MNVKNEWIAEQMNRKTDGWMDWFMDKLRSEHVPLTLSTLPFRPYSSATHPDSQLILETSPSRWTCTRLAGTKRPMTRTQSPHISASQCTCRSPPFPRIPISCSSLNDASRLPRVTSTTTSSTTSLTKGRGRKSYDDKSVSIVLLIWAADPSIHVSNLFNNRPFSNHKLPLITMTIDSFL